MNIYSEMQLFNASEIIKKQILLVYILKRATFFIDEKTITASVQQVWSIRHDF